jgi:hypothetical protein
VRSIQRLPTNHLIPGTLNDDVVVKGALRLDHRKPSRGTCDWVRSCRRPLIRLGFALALTLTGVTAASCKRHDEPSVTGDTHQAQSSMSIGYDRAMEDMASHFWDPGAGGIEPQHIRTTEGDGGSRNGLIAPGARKPTFWQMAQYANVLYNAWRLGADPDTRDKIIANWQYVRKATSVHDLSGNGAADGSVNISDDAAWKANYFAQVHEVTGDPQALTALLNMIPATLDRFVVPGQRRRIYGASPSGATFASGQYGILYAAANDRKGLATYCFCSSLYETMLADASLYAFDHTKNPAYREYAAATWDWVHANLRTAKERTGDAATGVYLAELVLPESTKDRTKPSARNRFWGKPIRGLAAEYDGGTLAMAVLSARLYRSTGEERYLAEARSIIAAFPRLDAFGRRVGARTLFVDARDPWTNGYWYPAVVSEVLTLPGVDTGGLFKTALQDTARAIMASRTERGFYGADWSGPELNFTDGTRTWIEAAHKANGGAGGGQATPEQIMTSASAVSVVQAAYALTQRPQ